MDPSAKKEARQYLQRFCKDIFGAMCPQNHEDELFEKLDTIYRQQLTAAHTEREGLRRRIQQQANLLQTRDKLIEGLNRQVNAVRTAQRA